MESDVSNSDNSDKSTGSKKLFYCTQCPKAFTTNYSAKIHESVHRNDRSWKCTLCKAAFNRRYHLVRHRKIHEGQKDNMCETCGKTFVLKEGLISHMLIHKDTSIVSCDICGNQYKNKNILKAHMRIHKNERNFTCEHCGRSFVQKVTYKSHVALHNRPSEKINRKALFKPLREFCSICDKGFADATGLRRHLRKHKLGILKAFNKLNRKTSNSVFENENCQYKEENVNESSIEGTENFSNEKLIQFSAVADEVYVMSVEGLQDPHEDVSCAEKKNTPNTSEAKMPNCVYSVPIDTDTTCTSPTNKSLIVTLNQESTSICYSKTNNIPVVDDNFQNNNSTFVNSAVCLNQPTTNNIEQSEDLHVSDGTSVIQRTYEIVDKVEEYSDVTNALPSNKQITNCVYGYDENGQLQLVYGNNQEGKSVLKTADSVHDNVDIESRYIMCNTTDLEQNVCTNYTGMNSSTKALTVINSEGSKLYASSSEIAIFEGTDNRRKSETECTVSQFYKKFKCSICSESFHMASTMSHHYQNVHKTEPCFLCKFCGLIFLGKTELQDHLNDNGCSKFTKNVEKKPSSKKPIHRTNNLKQNNSLLHGKLSQGHIAMTKRMEKSSICEEIGVLSTEARYSASSDGLEVEKRSYNNDLLENSTGSVENEEEGMLLGNRNEIDKIQSCGLPGASCTGVCTSQSESLTSAVVEKSRENVSEISTILGSKKSDKVGLTCGKCEQTFKTLTLLKRHKLKKICKEHLECKICKEEFDTQLKLLTHSAVIHDEKPFKCELCSKVFASSSGFNKHKKKHKSDSPTETLCKDFLCSLCGKCFSTHNTLKNHILTHSEPRRFCCKYCSMGFNQKHHMLRHIQTCHDNVRNFKCSIEGCEKQFPDRYRLALHIRTHTKEKPYQCEHCKMSFSTVSIMKTHIKTQHKKLKEFSCHICLQEFSAKHTLQKHLERHLAEEKMNPASENYVPGFTANIRQVAKMKPKTFFCSECEKTFTTRRGLLAHQRMRCVKLNNIF